MTDYEKQAEEFLQKTGTTFSAEFVKHGKHFTDEKYSRDIYTCELRRGDRFYIFQFGQSLKESITPEHRKQIKNRKKELEKLKPTAYDVLACLQKYDVGTFEDFCSEFGYDADSRKAEKIYKAVLDEWRNVQILFSDEELEELREIQ